MYALCTYFYNMATERKQRPLLLKVLNYILNIKKALLRVQGKLIVVNIQIFC